MLAKPTPQRMRHENRVPSHQYTNYKANIV